MICQSYPSNTCLRELLQNADDAEATEIEYVLDTKAYDGPLLHDELLDYRGPALLARNNSVFSEKDFDSLSSVGDSGKREDPASTGKFGQGFNSVYHWTDGPWIYSRNWLLILDPHERWSASEEINKPRGPTWDVVGNQNSVEIQNHMKALGAFDFDHRLVFNETIIRIPLRTEAQKETSKISKHAISITDIKVALEEFAREIRDGGLLFLKHIRKVIIRVDDSVVLTAQIIEDDSCDTRSRRELSTDFRRLYAPHPTETGLVDVSKMFEVNIKYSDTRSTRTDNYLVHHTMTRSCGDEELDTWARELKLYPWVAIAAPLARFSPDGAFSGRLFSTLILPIPTKQPVHMHGLFAIAPDRARLGFENLAMKWNEYMFKDRISAAWTKLLVHRSPLSWQAEGFGLWPRADLSHSDLWTRLDDWIVDRVVTDNLKVWNAISGCCVALDQGFFSNSSAKDTKYVTSLAQIQMPVVILEQNLLQKIEERVNSHAKRLKMRTPTTVRHFVRDCNELISTLPGDTAASILEHCLLDAIDSDLRGESRAVLYCDLHGIRLWPTVNGTLAAIPPIGALFLPRDVAEQQLFSGTRMHDTMNIKELTPTVRDLLRADIAYLGGVMRFRALHDLAEDWPNMYEGAFQYGDTHEMKQRVRDSDQLIHNIWTWMSFRFKEEKQKLPSSLNSTWLVPTNDSRIRQISPSSECLLTLIIEKGETLAGFLLEAASRISLSASPLLDTDVMPADAVKFLRKQSKTNLGLRLTCQDSLETFVDWLVAGQQILHSASSQERKMILKHLEKLVRDQSDLKSLSRGLASQVRKLPLFSKTTSIAPYKERFLSMCSLDQDGYLCEAPYDLPPLPDIEGVSFYDVSNASERYVIRQLKLLENLPLEQILTQHLLPWMATTQDSVSMPAKAALVDWIFDHSKSPKDSWKKNIISQPIVPLPTGHGNMQYRCLKDLVDPTSPYSALYFDEENVFPDAEFFARHKIAFEACGISAGLNEDTPLDRARFYSRCGADKQLLMDKVIHLLQGRVPYEVSSAELPTDEIRALKWLPGTSTTKEMALFSPNVCRGADESPLVDRVWGTLNFTVSRYWRKVLGWDQDIPTEVLLQQLDHCLEEKDYEKVDKLLLHMKPTDFPQLQSKACILGCHRNYMSPRRSFRSGSMLTKYPLAPYADEVDGGFAENHATLLAVLDIRHEPSVEDLQYVQQSLDKSDQGQLNDSDLHIAIATLEISAHLRYDPIKLHIPDTTCTLRNLSDIVHGDRNVRGDISSFNFTHPRVSEYLIKQLEIEDSFERAIKLDINFEDEDEDEYTQRESLTTVICDTLGRYPIETTFNEYLANADDAGATRISWTIDDCQAGPHKSDSLLAPELAPFQGAALIAYNDGTFSEKDFDGFKEIGQGGKGDDATTTGMFGRGALTMYHFTDVPMILSGGYYLILDPQQERLPRNKHHTRKAGVKISLATARRVAMDQLSPFDGLYGYDKSNNYFDGTIFRFPFRAHGIKTTLKDATQPVDSRTARTLLEDYFQTARVSLLFLPNVEDLEFRIRGEDRPTWKVSAHRSESLEDPDVFRRVTIKSTKEGYRTETDVWQVGMTDIERSPEDVKKVGKSSSKLTECGIAACLQQGAWDTDIKSSDGKVRPVDLHKGPMKCIDQKVFCKLPTSAESDLPVSFHASFAITGDRKTIAFEDHSEIAVWNRWLLADCLPRFYLDFLVNLSPKLGDEAFRFWPSKSSTGSLTTLSKTVALGFWDKITDIDHVHEKLYPAVSLEAPAALQGANDLRRVKPRKTRKLQEVHPLSNAHFDFLPEAISDKLGPLFANLQLNRVRPPQRLWSNLKHTASGLQLTELNSVFLARLLQEESNCKHLEAFLARFANEKDKAEAMAMLLEVLVPVTDGQDVTPLHMLNGCRALPRPSLDASLGLWTLNPQADSEWHFVATVEEQELFAFACGSMVNTRLFSPAVIKTGGADIWRQSRNPIADIMRAPFNVRKLEIGDVGPLLARPESLSALEKSSDKRDKWIKKMWTYLNCRFKALKNVEKTDANAAPKTTEDLLSKASVWNAAIYRFSRDKQWQYITPRQFERDPCIVEPMNEQQQKLCALIPDLRCLDPSCLPYLLSERESDMDQVSSFGRFLDALQKIERLNGVKLNTFLAKVLSSEAKETLRGLLITFLKNYLKSKDVPHSHRNTLLSLPVWPRIKRAEYSHLLEHLAAEDAWFFEHKAMIMPWVKDIGHFVDPAVVKIEESSLLKLGVKLTTVEAFWQHVKKDLPSKVSDEASRQHHLRLVKYFAKYGIMPLANIAPNGNGFLGKIRDLYDHDDEIFQSAFREEKSTRFLHPEFQSLRSFWVSIGLRARPATKVMSSDDFLQCALALDRRYKPAMWDQIFDQDALVVSTHLQYDRPEFHSWSASTWEQISKVQMFEVQKNVLSQCHYRQERMRQISQEQSHCALKDTGRTDNMRVLWSQVKFLKDGPAASVFDRLPGGGSPSTGMVYKHLQFLMSKRSNVTQRDIQEYLKDVQACYSHLQDNADSARKLHGIREAQIWFNFDTTQIDIIRKADVEASLTSARLLCLNTPFDPLPIRVIRKFLVPYERLLKVLGCKSVVQPAPAAPLPQEKAPPMAQSMVKIRRFRDQSQLTDVIFKAEGREKPAHKIFLAAVSEYCEAQFLGAWGRQLVHNATIDIEDMRYNTLSSMVDFAYSGEYHGPELKNPVDSDEIGGEILDVLTDLFDLLDGTNRWLLDGLHTMVENFLLTSPNSWTYIRPDTVNFVEERAGRARAERLVKYCQEFKNKNAAFLEDDDVEVD